MVSLGDMRIESLVDVVHFFLLHVYKFFGNVFTLTLWGAVNQFRFVNAVVKTFYIVTETRWSVFLILCGVWLIRFSFDTIHPLDITFKVGIYHKWNSLRSFIILKLGIRGVTIFIRLWILMSLILVVKVPMTWKFFSLILFLSESSLKMV